VAVKAWHLLVVCVVAIVAVAAVAGFVRLGHSAANVTKTIALVPATMPQEAAEQAAEANVREALPSVEAYYADHGTYAGATIDALRTYDSGIDSTVAVGWAENAGYCIESTVAGQTASVTGPSGSPALRAC
jgi:hypothetical protein